MTDVKEIALDKRPLPTLNKLVSTRNLLIVLGCSLSGVALFLSFFVNFWRIANADWFARHERVMESYIVGRMAQSRQDGIWSHGGLTGTGRLAAPVADYVYKSPTADQHLAYEKGVPFATFTTYNSQIGGQGMFFSLLDHWLPIPPQAKLRLFQALTALVSAIILTAVILWFHLEFGPLAGLASFLSVFCSQWLVVFGRNLWWSLWSFYLPMVASMFYLRRHPSLAEFRPLCLGVIIFLATLLKCLFTGYEYITTTLIMMAVPLVYSGIREQTNFREFCRKGLVVAGGAGLAVLLSLLILCAQIAAVKGRADAGIAHIYYSFQMRTHSASTNFPAEIAGPREAKSLKASTAEVLALYLKTGIYFDANNFIYVQNPWVAEHLQKVRYSHLIVLFMLASGVLRLRERRLPEAEGRKSRALLAATWFAVLAPLSWLVIFKAHSFVHPHMNHVVWQMPFVSYGFALCALALESLWPGAVVPASRRTSCAGRIPPPPRPETGKEPRG